MAALTHAFRAGSSSSRRPHPSGFTLIELTVVLAVIVTLALVLTPSIANFITDARVARARSDTQTFAGAITQFFRDNGFYPQWSVAQNGGPGTAQNKVDVLVSAGNVPASAGVSTNPWTTGSTDLLADQLMTNAPGYTNKTAGAQFGWNGPYLSSEIGADAWNFRYMVNVGLLDPSQGVGNKNAVWVICAGPNGTMDTAHTQSVLTAVLTSDDIGFRIQ